MDAHTLLAALIPLPEGGGELLRGDGSRDHFPRLFQALLDQALASKGLLHFGEQEKVSWRQVQQIRRVLQHLDVVVGDPVFDNGGHVDWRIVPMKPPLLCTQFRSLFPQMPQECGKDRDNVIGIHRLAFGDNVGINKTLAIKKRHDHLFRPTCMDFCLDGPRLTPFYPLLGLSFGLRCVVTNHCLVHGHYSVHHRHGVPLDGGDEFSSGLHSLFFLLWVKQPWHPSCCLLFQTQIFTKNPVDRV